VHQSKPLPSMSSKPVAAFLVVFLALATPGPKLFRPVATFLPFTLMLMLISCRNGSGG
jgi:hypothetical protein